MKPELKAKKREYGTKFLGIRIEPELYNRFEALCDELDVTKSSLARVAIHEYLEMKKNTKNEGKA